MNVAFPGHTPLSHQYQTGVGGGGGLGGILLYLYWINEFRTTKDWHDLNGPYDETYLVNLGPEQIYVLRDRLLNMLFLELEKWNQNI